MPTDTLVQPAAAPAAEVARPLQLFIDGQWLGGEGRRVQPVVNPATGETTALLPHATTADLDLALSGAQRGFELWRHTLAKDRADILHKAAGLLRARADAIARLLTLENGKPIGEGYWEVGHAADVLDWCAEEGRRATGKVLQPRAPGGQSLVLREPIGPVAGFTPWNVPLGLAANKVAMALAAGCSMIIKPAEETPSAPLALAAALHDAGLPAGVLSMVFGVPSDISTYLIASPIIRKVAFTGSTAVGKELARLAAPGLKPLTLELGGHAPVLVFEDADLDQAVGELAGFKFFNCGQVCFSPTRFYVHDKVHDAFVERMVAVAEELTVGNGLDPQTRMGPMANPRRVEAMKALVADAVGKGARLATGGETIGNRGNFFQPTVLADTPQSARIMNEEPFGPVVATARFSDFDAAMREANRLPMGLAAYAFTRDSRTIDAAIAAFDCGLVGINNCNVASVDSPFGGVKDSGYGKEYGIEGLDAYSHFKHVHRV